jgi:lipopolysaccharide export LptBFGC system permease protein LptF
MWIIERYCLTRIIKRIFFTTILLLILSFLVVFGQMLGSTKVVMTTREIFSILACFIPQIFWMVIPFSYFLATILVMDSSVRHHEMVIFRQCNWTACRQLIMLIMTSFCFVCLMLSVDKFCHTWQQMMKPVQAHPLSGFRLGELRPLLKTKLFYYQETGGQSSPFLIFRHDLNRRSGEWLVGQGQSFQQKAHWLSVNQVWLTSFSSKEDESQMHINQWRVPMPDTTLSSLPPFDTFYDLHKHQNNNLRAKVAFEQRLFYLIACFVLIGPIMCMTTGLVSRRNREFFRFIQVFIVYGIYLSGLCFVDQLMYFPGYPLWLGMWPWHSLMLFLSWLWWLKQRGLT